MKGRRCTLRIASAVFLLPALVLLGCGSEKKPEKAQVIAKATASLGRVIVIGFDGLEPTLVKKYVAQNELPNFARIIDQGAFGTLMSTLPPSSASAWTSAVTGVNPGKHGIYGFMGEPKPDASGAVVFNTSLQRGFKTVWQVLSDYGRRSIAINIPLTSPADSLNGLMVAGFPHASDDSSAYYWPRSLQKELADYSFDAFRVICAKNREDRFIQKMNGIESKRLEVGLRLFDKNTWDLFWLVFTFTDRYQHYLWKYTDKNHPMYDPVGGSEYGGQIEACYVQADTYLGEFVKRMRDDDLLVVMSDHGFGSLYYTVNGQNFLYRTLGATPDVTCADFFGAKFKIDVSGPNSEERYASIRNRLIEGLRALKDPAKGVPIIDSIYVKEQVYKGPYLSSAPDIVCMENPDYLFFTLPRTPDLRIIDAGPSPDKAFSGFHRRPGTICLYGKLVLPGKQLAARIVDVTPIILAYLGVPAPSEIDGRLPAQTFKAGPSGELRLVKSNDPGYRTRTGFLTQDSKKMEKQLRALGYMQ
jgi:predicted AlkP superfamily phosphohydrolase/phosphomutase